MKYFPESNMCHHCFCDEQEPLIHLNFPQSASVLQSPPLIQPRVAGGLLFFLGTYKLQSLPNLARQHSVLYSPGLQEAIFGVINPKSFMEDLGQAQTTFSERLASAM